MPRDRMPRTVRGGLLAALMLLPGAASAGDLMDLYQQAQQRDTRILAARAQRDELLEQRPQAIAVLLPQVRLQAGFDKNRLHDYDSTQYTFIDPDTNLPVTTNSSGTDNYDETTYGLTLQQSLFDWQQFRQLEQADALVAQAHAAFRAAEQDLLYRVADAYFVALNAQETLQSDGEAHAAYAEQMQAAKKKFDIGLATITDVRNAQAAYDNSQATLIADRRARDSALRALGELTGAPVNGLTPLRQEIPLEAPNPTAEADWVKAALDGNPSLQSYVHAADAARASVAANGGAYYPRVALVGSTGRSDSDYRFGADRKIDSIGVQAQWDVFQGGLTRSRVREAEAILERREADLEGQRRAVDRQARDAYEGVISGIASINATLQSVRSYQTSLDASTIGLKVGARTQADVLDAQRDLAASRRSFYAARYEYLRSTLQLQQQAGSLQPEDLVHIDGLLDPQARFVAAGDAPVREDTVAAAPPSPPPAAPAAVAPKPAAVAVVPTPPAPSAPAKPAPAAVATPPPVAAAVPVPAPAPPSPPKPAPAAQGKKIVGDGWNKTPDGTVTLAYPAGRAKLTQAQIDWLTTEAAGIRDRLEQHPEQRLMITGFVDKGTDGKELEALAIRRAAVVRETLAAAGVPVPRMSTRGNPAGLDGVRGAEARFETAPKAP